MKHVFTYLYLLFLLAVVSCSKEFPLEPAINNNEKSVALKVAIPYTAPKGASTRSIGHNEENTIETLDVLAFKVDGGVETFLYRAEAKKDAGNTEGSSIQTFNVKLIVKDHAQRFVLVTNAHSKIVSFIGSHPAGWVGEGKEVMLQNLTFDLNGGDRWKAISASNYTAIPMWGQTAPKTISTATTTISVDPIPMLRMVAKIDVQLDQSVSGIADAFKLKSVHLYNTNSSGRIIPKPGTEYIGTDMIAKKASLPSPVTPAAGPLAYSDFTLPGTTDVAMKGAVYLFETAAKNTGNPLNETCIVVGGIYGSDVSPTYYRLDFFAQDGTTHLDILRNHKYTFNITAVKSRGYSTIDEAYKAKSFNMETNFLVWDEGQIHYIYFDHQYMLGVSHDSFELDGEAHNANSTDNILLVTTDHPAGWTASVWADVAGTIPVSWLSIAQTSGAGGAQPDEMRLLTLSNPIFGTRTGYVHFKAGALSCVVKVTQGVSMESISGGGALPTGVTTFVGAFWRYNQKGERIIRIPNAYGASAANQGPWSVTVAWYDSNWNPASGDGIVLGTDKLTIQELANRGISYTSVIPNNQISDAENHPVTGNASTINGVVDVSNPDIIFRIGLQKNFTSYHQTNKPARYAVIIINYGTPAKMQKLFMRQGEGADYLMRPGDANAIGTRGAAAVRWSPYNLTSPAGWGFGVNGVQLVREGGFTQYPTQAGALFQWANTGTGANDRSRFAWNTWDTNYVSIPTLSPTWNKTVPGTGVYWGTGVINGIDHETCPAGFRRPNDGDTFAGVPYYNTDSGIATSEMRQSLYEVPPITLSDSHTENSIGGFYADGFFDRRQIVSAQNYYNSYANTTVSAENSDMAYIGRLFFNKKSNASLFFPAVGVRQSNGERQSAGAYGYYLSSSSYSNYTVVLGAGAVAGNNVYQYTLNRDYGVSIRCVANES